MQDLMLGEHLVDKKSCLMSTAGPRQSQMVAESFSLPKYCL